MHPNGTTKSHPPPSIVKALTPSQLADTPSSPLPHNHAHLGRDSLTLVNPCCMAYGFIVVGMAAGPFLRCTMMGRRSSRSMSFVLRRSSAMSVGRALHARLSAPTRGWQLSEDRQGVSAGAQRVNLARFVAALCAEPFARISSGTVHTCLIIFFASSRLIGWPSRSRIW